jgi:hypothetical protein
MEWSLPRNDKHFSSLLLLIMPGRLTAQETGANEDAGRQERRFQGR